MSEQRRRKRAYTEDEIAARQAMILFHASETIGERGVDGLNLSDIARKAGCSIGMLQHHFQTRAELLQESARYRSETSVAEWQSISASASDPMVRLRRLIAFTTSGERSFADAWGFWIELYGAARRDKELQAIAAQALDAWRSLFIEAITEAQQAGKIAPDIDANDVVTTFLAAVDGFALQALAGIFGITPDIMLARLTRLAALLLNVEEASLRTPTVDTSGPTT